MKQGEIAISAVAYDERDPSGLNRYTGEFLRGMMPAQPGLVAFATSPGLSELYGEQVRRIGPRTMSESNFKGNLLRLAWYQAVLPRTLKRMRSHVLYSPVPEGMISPPCRQVITIHDVLPLRFPEVYPRLKYYFRYVLPKIIDASDAIIVDSQATAEDVRRFYRTEDKPIHVVYPGYDSGLFRHQDMRTVERAKSSYQLKKFVLSVGETRPYKNIRGLINAFAQVQIPELQLAIVGKGSKMDPDLKGLPGMLGIADRVKFLGYVPDADLVALYGGAQAFVFPSLYEGFGFPALEAMACGCPVIASIAASIPEVCGEAAEYVDPASSDSIAAGIRRIVCDPMLRKSLAEQGLRRAENFGYDRAALRVLEILHGQSAQSSPRRN